MAALLERGRGQEDLFGQRTLFDDVVHGCPVRSPRDGFDSIVPHPGPPCQVIPTRGRHVRRRPAATSATNLTPRPPPPPGRCASVHAPAPWRSSPTAARTTAVRPP